MNLTNPEKTVTEERLNEYHQTILPYLGGMPDILANKFSRADLYSTDEKMIGRWTDGKPLYQKTVDCGALPNNAIKTVNHGITNIDKFVKLTGVAEGMTSDNNWHIVRDLPHVSVNSINYGILIESDQLKCTIQTASDCSNLHGYITLQYTKTTDSSVEIGLDTDYSTTEKIVGTWIDGKPIYQKTISCGGLKNNDALSVNHNIANIDKVFIAGGFALNSSGNSIPIGYYDVMYPQYSVRPSVDKTQILIRTVQDMSEYTESYVTLQYTKTTD